MFKLKLNFKYNSIRFGSIAKHMKVQYKKIQKYRKASVENKSRATASVKEHRALYEAIAARDSEKASKLALEHINNAYMHIIRKD